MVIIGCRFSIMNQIMAQHSPLITNHYRELDSNRLSRNVDKLNYLLGNVVKTKIKQQTTITA